MIRETRRPVRYNFHELLSAHPPGTDSEIAHHSLAVCDRLHYLAHITAGNANEYDSRPHRKRDKASDSRQNPERHPAPARLRNPRRFRHRRGPTRRSPQWREDRACQLSCAPGPCGGCQTRGRCHLNQRARRNRARHARPARPGRGILPPHTGSARGRPRS